MTLGMGRLGDRFPKGFLAIFSFRFGTTVALRAVMVWNQLLDLMETSLQILDSSLDKILPPSMTLLSDRSS